VVICRWNLAAYARPILRRAASVSQRKERVTLTEPQRLDCERYVMRKSWRCRRMPRRSRRLVWECLDLMPLAMKKAAADLDWQRWLREEVAYEAREQTKSAAVLWLILKFVLPVIIRLVVEWWLSRRGEA